MKKIMIAIALTLWSISFAALPAAMDKEQANNQAVIDNHKQWLIENQNPVLDDAAYLLSIQHAHAEHANQFLRRAYSEISVAQAQTSTQASN